MKKLRVIARLDVKGPNLVKGIHLEGLRVLGDPSAYANFYAKEGIDEIFYMDVVASLFGRNSMDDLIKQTAKEIFVPLTVGGGLRTVDDISRVLKFGADKVCINTAAVRDPEFIRRASQKFGRSTIVVALECIRQSNGTYGIYTDNGREETGFEAISWAKRCEELGAGEIVLTSVDKEGTGKGGNVELLRSVRSAVSIPVVYHGGIGNFDHAVEVAQAKPSGLAIASSFHYDALPHFTNDNLQLIEGNTRFLQTRSIGSSRGFSVSQLKENLLVRNIPVRKL